MSQQLRQNATIGDYVIGKTIGRGTFGKVKLGTHTITKEKVAIKILEKSKIQEQADNERVSREIQILRAIRHPNIIQLYEIISTPTKLFLIMEYADGGELFQLIVSNQRLDEFQASKYLQQIINAVEYMHQMGIAHRDLKPENLLLDHRQNIKVVDFGLSNLYKERNQLTTACGSPCYAAPQMVSGHAYDGLKTDMWSCGIIMYAMICGYLPFEDPDTSQLYKKIKTGDFEIPSFVSLTAKDLLMKIMHIDPEKRATIEMVRKHNFCMKKEIPVKGILPGYVMQPEKDLLKQMEKYDMSVQTTRQQLLNNKHNRNTATYYLMLKQWVRKNNSTLLDYFRQKELEGHDNERTSVIIRKRKVQSLQKQGSKQLRLLSRELDKLDDKEGLRRISQELTKNTSRQLIHTKSKNNFRSPLLRLTDRPPISQMYKKSTIDVGRRPSRSRVRMKSEIDPSKPMKTHNSKQVMKLVEIIDRRLSKLNINIDKMVSRPVIFMAEPHKTHVDQSPSGNAEDNMLRRIYRKNLDKLQHSVSKVRSKSKQ